MKVRLLLPAGIATLAFLAHPLAAMAQWSAGGTGSGGAAATTMPTGATPTATARGNQVLVRWPPATLGSGTAVAGYDIRRYNAVNGSQVSIGAGCAGIITTTSCIEQSVPSGTWYYTDTPVQASWTGGESSPSATVTIP